MDAKGYLWLGAFVGVGVFLIDIATLKALQAKGGGDD